MNLDKDELVISGTLIALVGTLLGVGLAIVFDDASLDRFAIMNSADGCRS